MFRSPTRHLRRTNLSAEWETPNKSHQDKAVAKGAFLMHCVQCNNLCDPFIYTEAGRFKVLYSDYAFYWMLRDCIFVSLLSVLKAFA